MDEAKELILVSACLLGVECRYDGQVKSNKSVAQLNERFVVIPVCPERLGGLLTPRVPAERIGPCVVDAKGVDVTEFFVLGAQRVLELVNRMGVKKAVMRSKSPSCGFGKIFDGTFSGTLVDGHGLTVEALLENGVEVYSEADVARLLS